jgi:hypothetical protein
MPTVLSSDEIVQSVSLKCLTSPPDLDPEKQAVQNGDETIVDAIKYLSSESSEDWDGWIAPKLYVSAWLAMAVGKFLGNFVSKTGATLQKAKFVGYIFHECRDWR